MEKTFYTLLIFAIVIGAVVLAIYVDIKHITKPKTPRNNFWTYEYPVPSLFKRTVSEITTEMLSQEENRDIYANRLMDLYYSKVKNNMAPDSEWRKIEDEAYNLRKEFYLQKHHRIHVRLSIKQTKK